MLLVLVLALGLGACSRGPSPGEPGRVEEGMASSYAHEFHGRTTASGDIYDMEALTAAHKTLPFGTVVRVTRVDTGNSVTVVITDRGPFVKGRIIDLSYRAARDLNMIREGVVRVQVEIVDD
jgi:rare lipoprotein A